MWSQRSDSSHLELLTRRKGVVEILLSGVCFGFLGLFGKLIYERGGTPGELLSIRFLLAASFLWLFFFFQNFNRVRLPAQVIARCAALGVLGYAVFSSFFFQALSGLSASLTVLLLYLYPVIVAVGGWTLFGERIPRQRWIAIPIALFGLMALVWDDFQITKASALIFGVGSAVFYSVYILGSSRWLRGVDPLVSVLYIQSFAGAALAAVHLRSVERITDLLSSTWLIFLGIALISTVAAMALFLAGLQKLRSWEASLLSLAEPITGVALAMLLLGDQLGITQLIGAIAVFAALAFVSVPVRR